MHINRTKDLSVNRVEIVRKALLPGKLLRAKELAEIAGVTERTIHRYILELRQSGEIINGEAGVGFQMVRKEKNGLMAGPGKPLTQLEIYETLAASYERERQTLVAKAVEMKDFPDAANSMFTAAYVVQALRAGALEVVEKLKRN